VKRRPVVKPTKLKAEGGVIGASFSPFEVLDILPYLKGGDSLDWR
jgi:hypothetical protein